MQLIFVNVFFTDQDSNVTELLQLEKKVLETLEEEGENRINVKDAWYIHHFSTFADVLLSGVLPSQIDAEVYRSGAHASGCHAWPSYRAVTLIFDQLML